MRIFFLLVDVVFHFFFSLFVLCSPVNLHVDQRISLPVTFRPYDKVIYLFSVLSNFPPFPFFSLHIVPLSLVPILSLFITLLFFKISFTITINQPRSAPHLHLLPLSIYLTSHPLHSLSILSLIPLYLTGCKVAEGVPSASGPRVRAVRGSAVYLHF